MPKRARLLAAAYWLRKINRGFPPRRNNETRSPFSRLRRLDRFRSRIPRNRFLPEIRFIRHVTGGGGVVAKNRVLRHRLPRLHRLEEDVQVRAHIVPVMPAIKDVFVRRLFAEWWIVLRMPLLQIFLAQFRGITRSVVAGLRIHARLRRIP